MEADSSPYWWMKYTAPTSRCDVEELAIDQAGTEYTRKALLEYMANNDDVDSEKLLSRSDCPRYLISKRLMLADVLASRDTKTAFVFSEKLYKAISSICDQSRNHYQWVRFFVVNSMSDTHPAYTYYVAMTPDDVQFSSSQAIGLDTKSSRAFSLYKSPKDYSDKWVLSCPPTLEYFWSASSGEGRRCHVRCCRDVFKKTFEGIGSTGFSFYPVNSVVTP